MHGLDLTVV